MGTGNSASSARAILLRRDREGCLFKAFQLDLNKFLFAMWGGCVFRSNRLSFIPLKEWNNLQRYQFINQIDEERNNMRNFLNNSDIKIPLLIQLENSLGIVCPIFPLFLISIYHQISCFEYKGSTLASELGVVREINVWFFLVPTKDARKGWIFLNAHLCMRLVEY